AAWLLAREYRSRHDLGAAMRATAARLEGAFTLVAMHREHPGLVVAARRDSPLVVGIGEGEVFLASDVAAFADNTRHALALGQNQVVAATPEGIVVTDLAGRPAEPEPFEVDWDPAAAQKGGWPSFMAKEIDEEPAAVTDTLRGRLDGGRVRLPELEGLLAAGFSVRKILILACGTAYYAGEAARHALEAWAGIPTSVELAHEFRYREPLVEEGTLVVTISQSGETMDTLMAARYARERGALTLSVCNTQGSSIPRESDAVLYTRAGPEVAVASTKAFVAQVVALLLVALHLAGRVPQTGAARGGLSDLHAAAIESLLKIPGQIRTVLDTQRPAVDAVAAKLAAVPSIFLLGRGVLLPVAREGALKLKETSYVHAEAFPAGELKHGPIALIEPGRPVIALAPPQGTLLGAKMDSTVQELRARGADVTVIGQVGGVPADDGPAGSGRVVIPETDPLLSPLLAVVPLHMLAMAVAGVRGVDVDQPRNLAKSVTVE
ncbi:MAG TPA: glutamine--fructose-6-phosphate transaminase (isomerizing), partial [Microbacteriaceae bacterium]|nr:glutamine--fructose-6-phosphate transaminase (isomerizing) [Microbacteriaceae bacterium]